MRPAERGFLLLTSHLGDPERKVLTVPQLRVLAQRTAGAGAGHPDRELTQEDLAAMGYGPTMSHQILMLLAEEDRLDYYLQRAARHGCVPITRASEQYPLILRRRLGLDSPGVLWAKGDEGLLGAPALALVGSRDMAEKNHAFAKEMGRQAALQGYVLVSGNARGADRTAQYSCLNAGGRLISVVADELWKWRPEEKVLYLSEDSWDEPFSAQRTLSRNRCIHALGLKTFVAQTRIGIGGTWNGTVKNLRNHWSPVYGFRDGSEGMNALEQMGATLIGIEELASFFDLPEDVPGFLDQE